MARITLQFESASLEETQRLGDALAKVARAGDVLALDGSLGAGKTALVRSLTRALGHDERMVSSPTFVLMNEYATEGKTPLVHVDAYRLSGSDDLDSIGWERATDGTAIVAVEWASRLDAASLGTPGRVARLAIEVTGESARRFKLDAPGEWSRREEWSELAALAAPVRTHTRCPTCGREVEPEAPTWPFHNDQCRMADLNTWFTGGFRVSREIVEDDLQERDNPETQV